MKKILIAVILFAAWCGWRAPASFADTNTPPGTAENARQLYTCGMHPQVIQDHPGNCPICGMKLTPMARSSLNSSTITIDPGTSQKMNLRTDLVTRGPVRRTFRTFGEIDFDETHLTDVTTKFGGWIEKLYADTSGTQVHRGDPLFELYSPEFFDAQISFIAAMNQATTMPSSTAILKAAARTNLFLLGVPPDQITDLEKTRKTTRTFTVTAPQDGFLVEKEAVLGQKVEAGMKLYRIADLGLVWVQAQIYEQDIPFVQLGQEAEVSLSYMPDRKFRGRVTYVYPTVDERTRTVKVRMEFHNPGYLLKPGMFATVELTAELAPDAVLVPDSAVLRSGEKNTVFVALDGGKFEPRVVALGPRSDNDTYQVLSGLNEGERVVTSGQFMLDSESQLREAIQKMMNPNAATPTLATTPMTTNAIAAFPDSTNSIYICPMPEHVSIRYDHPGKCPLCGMTLVPVSEAMLAKVQPGGRILYYTCPMTDDCPTPNHGLVHMDKPGKCPVCGMTLVPVMDNSSAAQTMTNAVMSLPDTLYTCPMPSHADVVSDKPGDCPKCGMALVPTTTVAHGKIAEENWRKQHPVENQP